MIRWRSVVRESIPVNYIFNVNQFPVDVCVFPRSTLPCADSPYPMLVLTGPQGCGKRELTHRLCQDLSEFFAYGSVSNIYILKLKYVAGTPQLEIINHICTYVYVHRICHTTRGPYYGEENGVDYHFLNEEEFQTMIYTVG